MGTPKGGVGGCKHHSLVLFVSCIMNE